MSISARSLMRLLSRVVSMSLCLVSCYTIGRGAAYMLTSLPSVIEAVS